MWCWTLVHLPVGLDCGPLSTYLWCWTGSTYQRAWTLDHGGCMYCTMVHLPVGLDCDTPTCGAGLCYSYLWSWTVTHLPVGLVWGTPTCGVGLRQCWSTRSRPQHPWTLCYRTAGAACTQPHPKQNHFSWILNYFKRWKSFDDESVNQTWKLRFQYYKSHFTRDTFGSIPGSK